MKCPRSHLTCVAGFVLGHGYTRVLKLVRALMFRVRTRATLEFVVCVRGVCKVSAMCVCVKCVFIRDVSDV